MTSSIASTTQNPDTYGSFEESNLRIVQNQELGTISIYRPDGTLPILTQDACQDHRPYLHPIIAPDGKVLSPNIALDTTNIKLGFIGASPESTAGLYLKINYLTGSMYLVISQKKYLKLWVEIIFIILGLTIGN